MNLKSAGVSFRRPVPDPQGIRPPAGIQGGRAAFLLDFPEDDVMKLGRMRDVCMPFVRAINADVLRPFYRWGLWMLAVLFLLASVGCSVDKHMARKSRELMDKMDAEPHWAQRPRKKIAWGPAVGMMMAGNLEMQRARQSVQQAERTVTNVFTQIIPGVNLDLMMTQELSQLANVSQDNLEYNTNILFAVPSPTQIPFDYYSAKASVYAAKKSMEMKERELISKMYRQVILYQNAMWARQAQLREIPFDDDGTMRRKADIEWENKLQEISLAFAELVGNMEAQWFVDPDSMPRIDWARYKKASRKLDLLVVTMAAMELEVSRLQVLNTKMKFFPSVDVNFYSPSLFTGKGGTYQGFFTGSNDIQVNMSLREELDTRLNVWNQYKTAKENHRMLQQRVRLELLKRRDKVAALIRSREDFESWDSATRKMLAFRRTQTVASGEDYLQQRKALKDIYKELDGEASKNAEVEAALIMEYGWLK